MRCTSTLPLCPVTTCCVSVSVSESESVSVSVSVSVSISVSVSVSVSVCQQGLCELACSLPEHAMHIHVATLPCDHLLCECECE